MSKARAGGPAPRCILCLRLENGLSICTKTLTEAMERHQHRHTFTGFTWQDFFVPVVLVLILSGTCIVLDDAFGGGLDGAAFPSAAGIALDSSSPSSPSQPPPPPPPPPSPRRPATVVAAAKPAVASAPDVPAVPHTRIATSAVPVLPLRTEEEAPITTEAAVVADGGVTLLADASRSDAPRRPRRARPSDVTDGAVKQPDDVAQSESSHLGPHPTTPAADGARVGGADDDTNDSTHAASDVEAARAGNGPADNAAGANPSVDAVNTANAASIADATDTHDDVAGAAPSRRTSTVPSIAAVTTPSAPVLPRVDLPNAPVSSPTPMGVVVESPTCTGKGWPEKHKKNQNKNRKGKRRRGRPCIASSFELQFSSWGFGVPADGMRVLLLDGKEHFIDTVDADGTIRPYEGVPVPRNVRQTVSVNFQGLGGHAYNATVLLLQPGGTEVARDAVRFRASRKVWRPSVRITTPYDGAVTSEARIAYKASSFDAPKDGRIVLELDGHRQTLGGADGKSARSSGGVRLEGITPGQHTARVFLETAAGKVVAWPRGDTTDGDGGAIAGAGPSHTITWTHTLASESPVATSAASPAASRSKSTKRKRKRKRASVSAGKGTGTGKKVGTGAAAGAGSGGAVQADDGSSASTNGGSASSAEVLADGSSSVLFSDGAQRVGNKGEAEKEAESIESIEETRENERDMDPMTPPTAVELVRMPTKRLRRRLRRLQEEVDVVQDAGVVLSLNNEIQAIEDVMEARWISQSVT